MLNESQKPRKNPEKTQKKPRKCLKNNPENKVCVFFKKLSMVQHTNYYDPYLINVQKDDKYIQHNLANFINVLLNLNHINF
jgi:hypothetical protein